MLYIRYLNRGYLILSSLMFAFSLWVKNEGAVFIFASVLCLFSFIFRTKTLDRKRILSDSLQFFSLIIIIAGPWFIFKFLNHLQNVDINYANLTFERLLGNIKGIPILLDRFQREVFQPKKWNIFWILVIFTIILKHKKLFKDYFFYISLFLFVSVIGYFIAYMSVTRFIFSEHIRITLPRSMIHFSGIFLFLVVYLFWDEAREKHVRPLQ